MDYLNNFFQFHPDAFHLMVLFGATTGASIWVVGAIGMACGFGFYALALVVTVAGLFVLTVLGLFTGRGVSRPEDHEPRDPE